MPNTPSPSNAARVAELNLGPWGHVKDLSQCSLHFGEGMQSLTIMAPAGGKIGLNIGDAIKELTETEIQSFRRRHTGTKEPAAHLDQYAAVNAGHLIDGYYIVRPGEVPAVTFACAKREAIANLKQSIANIESMTVGAFRALGFQEHHFAEVSK